MDKENSGMKLLALWLLFSFCVKSVASPSEADFFRYDINDFKRKYIYAKSGYLVDLRYGLMWEMKKNIDGVTNFNNPSDGDNIYNSKFNDGNKSIYSFIHKLNAISEFNDWEIPIYDELVSLYDLSKSEPPYITDLLPTNRLCSRYWTSDIKNDTVYQQQHLINFNLSADKMSAPYRSELCVLAVRKISQKEREELLGIKPLNKRFVDNQDGTITDFGLRIMWQKNAQSQCFKNIITGSSTYTEKKLEIHSGTYSTVVSKIDLYNKGKLNCDDLPDSYNNWRLPTVDELISLRNFDKQTFVINDYIPIKNLFYCSGTSISKSNAFGVYENVCGIVVKTLVQYYTSEEKSGKSIVINFYDGDISYMPGYKVNNGYAFAPNQVMVVRDLDITHDISNQFEAGVVAGKSSCIADPVNCGVNIEKYKNEGKLQVIKSPKSYNLFLKSEVDAAIDKGISSVLEYPYIYNLVPTKKFNIINDELVLNLTDGWSLLSVSVEISDLRVFDSAKIIWIYKSGEYYGYSSNKDTMEKIVNSGYKIIDGVINPGFGVWVKK